VSAESVLCMIAAVKQYAIARHCVYDIEASELGHDHNDKFHNIVYVHIQLHEVLYRRRSSDIARLDAVLCLDCQQSSAKHWHRYGHMISSSRSVV
jgi:hypothetical protein